MYFLNACIISFPILSKDSNEIGQDEFDVIICIMQSTNNFSSTLSSPSLNTTLCALLQAQCAAIVSQTPFH